MKRFIMIVIVLAAVASVHATAATDQENRDSRLISVYDQGIERSFLTQESTLDKALTSAGIALDERDSVEPSRHEELVASSYQVNIYRARPIVIVDNNIRLKILSSHQTASQIAADAGVPLREADIATFELATNIITDGAGQIMTITRARQLTLELHGSKMLLRTQASTVGELLQQKNITLDASDSLSHHTDTPITEGMGLRIWREGLQTVAVEEEIAPPSRFIYDVNRPLGYRAVQTEGQPGLRTVTYQTDIRNGQVLYRTQLNSVVIRQPTEKIEVIGLQNDGRGLTAAKGAQYFVDSKGVSHRETYYDLPMNVVMSACGQNGFYTVRPDGVKVDRDGYVIVAANYGNYPRCSVVETSLGPGKVYDTGGFAVRHPHGFDLATDWTRRDGI